MPLIFGVVNTTNSGSIRLHLLILNVNRYDFLFSFTINSMINEFAKSIQLLSKLKYKSVNIHI